jgi:hypothetical protein
MASSPSRYLGAALLQGVGAGAKTYESVQGEMLKRQADSATAARAAFQFYPGIGPGVLATDTKTGALRVVPATEYQKNPAQFILPTQNEVPTENAGQPNVEPTSVITPHFNAQSVAAAVKDRDLANSAQSQAQFNNMGEASVKKLTEMSSQAESAYNSKPSLQQLALTLAQADQKSWAGPGPFAQKTALVGSVLNQFGSVLGFGPNYFSDATTDQDINSKITTLLASDAAKSADQHAVQALRAYQAATPNRSMDPKAAAELAASLMVSNQTYIDKNQFASIYGKQSQGVIGPNFEPQFRNEFDEQKYNTERSFLQKLMLDPKGKIYLSAITSGSRTPADIQHFFTINKVPEVARYFVQGAK